MTTATRRARYPDTPAGWLARTRDQLDYACEGRAHALTWARKRRRGGGSVSTGTCTWCRGTVTVTQDAGGSTFIAWPRYRLRHRFVNSVRWCERR